MKKPIYKIALLAYEDVIPATLFAFRDLIMFANMIASASHGGNIQVDLVSANGGQVQLGGGTAINTKSLSRTQYDALVVPGFIISNKQAFNLLEARLHKEIALIKRQYNKGVLIAANCVGAFLLGAAGILNGHRVTTSWLFAEKLAMLYPEAKVEPKHVLIKDDPILSTGAFSAMNDLAGFFIKAHLGKEVLSQTQNLTLSPGVGGNQDRFIDSRLQSVKHSPFVERVQSWLQQHLDQKYSLDALAQSLSMTPRTLMRRYKQETQSTPLLYLQQKRMQKAKQLLINSDLSVEQVAEHVGYQDVNGFRKVFYREVGERPSVFRKTMGAQYEY